MNNETIRYARWGTTSAADPIAVRYESTNPDGPIQIGNTDWDWKITVDDTAELADRLAAAVEFARIKRGRLNAALVAINEHAGKATR